MSSWSGIEEYLRGRRSRGEDERLEKLFGKVPLDTICATLLDPQIDGESKEKLSDILVDGLCSSRFCREHLLSPLLEFLSIPDTHSVPLPSIINFQKALFNLDEDELVSRILRYLLPLQIQLSNIATAVLAYQRESGNGLAQTGNGLAVTLGGLNELMYHIIWPAFDSPITAVSQSVSDGILNSLNGVMLPADVGPDIFPDKDALIPIFAAWRNGSRPPEIINFLLKSGLIQGLEQRLSGENITRKNSRPEPRRVDASTLKVRAAVLLIKLSDMSETLTQRSADKEWFSIIVKELYHTNDPLLRLTAAEIISDEIAQTNAGLTYLSTTNLYKTFSEDLNDEEQGLTLRLSIMRLLARLFYQVPAIRSEIVSEKKGLLWNMRKLLDDCEPLSKDICLETVLGCVGCVACGGNEVGNKALKDANIEWAKLLTQHLREGTDNISLAAHAAMLRVVKNAEADFLEKSSDSIVPTVVDLLVEKPVSATRALTFDLLTAFTEAGMQLAFECFCNNSDLQMAFFRPNVPEPSPVVYAKHHFVKAAISKFESHLEQICPDSHLRTALLQYSKSNAFDLPTIPFLQPFVTQADQACDH